MTRTIKAALHCLPNRPIAAVVGLDPAYSGNAGLAILVRPQLPSGAGLATLHAYRSCKLLDVATQRWLGDTIAEVCRPGECVAFVCESDAFGGHAVARKLGIGIGIVQGLLLDLNATDPDGRVDVATSTWRTVVKLPRGRGRIVKGEGRALAKARAVAFAEYRFGLTGMPVDAAEAACIAEWWSINNPTWGTHVRPRVSTPTGLKREES